MHYTREETAFAQALQKTLTEQRDAPLSQAAEVLEADAGTVSGSTDVGDVNWIVPTAQFNIATYVPGTPGHSWQSAACAGSSIG